jgi:hypothetical protein
MGIKGRVRLQPVRRTILLGLGAGAAALWGLRAARAAPPDHSSPAVPASPAIAPSPSIAPNPMAPSTPAAAGTAVLYEEDPDVPTGKRFPGDVHWRLDTKADAKGGAAETVVRARVEVPDRGMALAATFGRNRDKSLPATHTIELIFTLPVGFTHGGIENVPGILMKASETAPGVPLGGVSVKVTTLYFLIGLTNREHEREANMRLLHERAWFDLPIVYSDKRRAILAFDKGRDGERAFSEAFAAWDDESASPAPGGGAAPKPGGDVEGHPKSK